MSGLSTGKRFHLDACPAVAGCVISPHRVLRGRCMRFCCSGSIGSDKMKDR